MDGQFMNYGKDDAPPSSGHHVDQMPPAATASYEDRAAWAERYVAWYLGQTPQARSGAADVAPTHAYQVEFNSAVLDPPEYYRDTQQELNQRAQTLH
jgi:hypothetical protein